MLRVGDPADFIVVEDLVGFHVNETFVNGQLVAKSGQCLMPPCETETLNNFVAGPISIEQLAVTATSSRVRVIEAIDGQLVTNKLVRECQIENGFAMTDADNDLLKMVVVNRYEPADPAIAFVTGFGLKSGGFASSVAHDSHNIVAVGTNDLDLAAAINAVTRAKGGLSVSIAGKTEVLPLPVAGLMSTESCQIVAERYSKLDCRLKEMGTSLRAPLMTLSFMALLVIPSLKLSDKGLFDADKFEFVRLFVD